MKHGPRTFWADTDAAASDWVILSAGIALLGIVTVYEVFEGGASDVVSRMNEGLTNGSGSTTAANGPPETSESASDGCEEPAAFEAPEDCEADTEPSPIPPG